MGLINSILAAGGQVVGAVTGAVTGTANQVQQAIVRPAVQTVQTVQRIAAPVVTQANRYVAPAVRTAQNVGRVTQTVTNPIAGVGGYVGNVAARTVIPYVNQAARYVAPTARTIQRVAPIALTAANPMAAVGRTVGINAVKTVTPYIQQASRSIAPTIRTVQRVAPIALTAANPMAAVGRTVGINAVKTVTPYIQQASRSIAPTIRTVQRVAPIALTAANPISAVGRTVGMVAAKSVTPGIQQAANNFGQISTSILRNPTQAITPAIKTIQRSAPIALAISNPVAAVGKVVGGVVAKSATPYIKQTGTLFAQASNSFIRNPVQTVLPVVRTVQQIAPISRGITNPIAGAGTLIGMATAKAVTPVLKQTGALFKSNPIRVQSAGNLTGGLFPVLALTSTLGGGDQKTWEASSISQNGTISKSGGWFNNRTVQGNATSQKPVAEIVKDPKDGSTDALGRLGKGDIIGAIGAGGKWLTTNIPPAAEATENWLINGPQNFVNLQAGHLERGEIPFFKQADDFIVTNRNKIISGNAYLTELDRGTPKDSPYTGPFSGAGSLMRDMNADALTSFRGAAVASVVGGTKFLGDVGGKAFTGDILGAAGVAAEGASNFATGAVTSVIEIPGRMIADPKHAPGQILGEFAAGEFLMGGAMKGTKVAKKTTFGTVGRSLGLINPDVIVHPPSTGRLRLPQMSLGENIEHMMEPSSDIVAHSSAGVMSWNPWGKVKTLTVSEEGQKAPGKWVTWGKGNGVVETSDVIMKRKEGKPLLWRIGTVISGPRVNLFHNVPHVRAPPELWAKAKMEADAQGYLSEKTFHAFESLAMEQSKALGQPVESFAPKRMHKMVFEAENESVLVFGSEKAKKMNGFKGKSFGGYTREGVKIVNVALGTQKLVRRAPAQLARNFKRQLSIEYVPRLGFRNSNVMDYWAIQANRKADIVTGIKPASKIESNFFDHGISHTDNTTANIHYQAETNPKLREKLSIEGEWIIGKGHDIGKVWAGDSLEPHGPLAAGLIRSGRISAFKNMYDALPKKEQKTIVRAIALHTDIKPRLLQKGGLKTKILLRPDIVSKATANADRWDFPRFGIEVNQKQLFALPTGGVIAGAGRTGINPLALGEDAVLFPGRGQVNRGDPTNASTKKLIDTFTGAAHRRFGGQSINVKPQLDSIVREVRNRIRNSGKKESVKRSKSSLQSSLFSEDVFGSPVKEKGYEKHLTSSKEKGKSSSGKSAKTRYSISSGGGYLTNPRYPGGYDERYSRTTKTPEYTPHVTEKPPKYPYTTEKPPKYPYTTEKPPKYPYTTEKPPKYPYTTEKPPKYPYTIKYPGSPGYPNGGTPYTPHYPNDPGYPYPSTPYTPHYPNDPGYPYPGTPYTPHYPNEPGHPYTPYPPTYPPTITIIPPYPPYPPTENPPYPPYYPPNTTITPPPPEKNVPDMTEIRGQRHGGMAAYDFYEVSGITDPDAIFAAAKKAPKSKKNRFPGLSPKTISIAKTTGKGKKIFGMPKIKRKRLF